MLSPRKHWSGISESGTVLGMKFLLLTYNIFGRRGFRFFLFPVMVYYYLSRREARMASKQYLQQVCQFLPNENHSELSSFRHFIMFGEILLDKLLVWMGQIRKQDVVFETPDTIREIEENRRGGIIIVSHLGNFEIGSALAHQAPNLRLTILVYTQHAKKFNALMHQSTNKADVEVMQVSNLSPVTAMMLSQRIDAGEHIVIAGDRTPISGKKRTSLVKFLGRDASMPQGAFYLAGLLKCPLYLLFCLKQKNRYNLYIERFTRNLELGERKKRQEILDESVQRYANRLEHYCLKAPLQWFNFFPYWNDDRPTEDSLDRFAGSGREKGIS